MRNSTPRLALLVCLGLALAACTDELANEPEPQTAATTSTTTTVAVERVTTLRVGIAVNEAAPTAELDAQIVRILNEASAGFNEAAVSYTHLTLPTICSV